MLSGLYEDGELERRALESTEQFAGGKQRTTNLLCDADGPACSEDTFHWMFVIKRYSNQSLIVSQ